MNIDHSYIEDTVRELFNELHDFLIEEFTQGMLPEEKERIKEMREHRRPFLGNLTQEDTNLIEDCAPKLFDNYSGESPLKDVLRAFIDTFYQYRMIHTNHQLYNELRHALEPKYNENKGSEERLRLFKSRIKDVYEFMGGDAYQYDGDRRVLINELKKAYTNPHQYIRPTKEDKPALDTEFTKWLKSLVLANKTD